MSGEPSWEPLSTTMTSNGRCTSCRASDCKHERKRSRRFQFTTTAEMDPLRFRFTDCSIITVTVPNGTCMFSIGERLRRARLEKGLSIDELAARTKIGAKFLE